MLRTITIRLLQAPIVLFVLITISFFLIRFAPGGPFSAERRLDPGIERALQSQYRLDKPLSSQYGLFLRDLLKGDLGPSFKHKDRTVNEIIAATLPHSILLGFLAFILALGCGLPAGILAAVKQDWATNYVLMGAAILGMSLPTFVIGPLLQLLFAIRWQWLPIAGFEGVAAPEYLVLPAVTLACPFAARIARLMRAGMLDVLSQDYIRTARAKGVPEVAVILRHALPGAILPVISYLGPAITQIATGSLVIEKIFQIPGLGREFVEGALSRDYTLVMGTVIVYGVFIIASNLFADLLYVALDPRVRYEE